MSWTDVFPVFTDHMIDEFETAATDEEKAVIDGMFEIAEVVNPADPGKTVVSLALVDAKDSEPLGGDPAVIILDALDVLHERHPEAVMVVHLSRALADHADRLSACGSEVRVMGPSAEAAAVLWPVLPLGERRGPVLVTSPDQLVGLEGDLARLDALGAAGVAAWRTPEVTDFFPPTISYRPIAGAFGVRDSVPELPLLVRSFAWHAGRGSLPLLANNPGCGQLPLAPVPWPGAGWLSIFAMLALYPRLAAGGMLAFVPSSARSLFLGLDVEYSTWANPASELVIYRNAGACC